jgi:outer membrane protein TolC
VDRRAYQIVEQTQREALGKTEFFTVEAPAEELRQRLLLDQALPYSGPASLGSQYLATPERWPRDDYLNSSPLDPAAVLPDTAGPIVLTLVDALQVAARNSRQYQNSKERVFRSALGLDLEQERFRTTFAGVLSGSYLHDRSGLQDPDGETHESLSASALLGTAKLLQSGAQLSLQLGWSVIKLLEPGRFTTHSLFGDASISVPLLRGAGRHIVTEPLTQAERDVVYAIFEFERFKQSFAVLIAANYFSVLQRQNEVQNSEENYRGLIASTRRARRLLDAGHLPAIQVDQAIQDELRARNRWVSARESYASALDAFKTLLGLPADAQLELDPAEFEKISQVVRGALEWAAPPEEEDMEADEPTPPADAEVVLEEPSPEDAGPWEFEPEKAIRIALGNRLDLRIREGEVSDAQRRVVVAADRLKGELTFFGSATVAGEDFSDLSPGAGTYEALLHIDLPLRRTPEAIVYRMSFLALEENVRNLQSLEDEIKLDVLNRLRVLREARESLRIQALSVELAQRRVRGADLNLQAGRAQIRDLLEAQEALLSARNSLTAATVAYRVAELELQRDLGVLEVGPDGLWKEFNPQEAL